MAIRKIVAKKGSRTRQFSEDEWKLLGKDKSGWEQISDMTVSSTLVADKNSEKKIIAPPATGKKEVKTMNVTNSVVEYEKDKVKEIPKTTDSNPDVSKEQKEEFMLSLEGLSKAVVKDAFDKQEPPVKYENRSALDQLKVQLAEHCNYDLKKKQELFSK